MQKRHVDRQTYFNELANTSRDFYVDYVKKFVPVKPGCKVLEIGCGDGGNLLPFAEAGCATTGIDRVETRITQARTFFSDFGQTGTFMTVDFFDLDIPDEGSKYDIILIHDVIEHVSDKEGFFKHTAKFLSGRGVVFWGFPAWQMPFGGHQQICGSKVCSNFPFLHLLPESFYRAILTWFGEPETRVRELIDIKRCGISIEDFEKLARNTGYAIADRRLWFINPHYKQKFNLKPRRLYNFISRVRYVRNFFCTSCFYITGCK